MASPLFPLSDGPLLGPPSLQSRNMPIFFQKWGISHFCLSGYFFFFFNFRRHAGAGGSQTHLRCPSHLQVTCPKPLAQQHPHTPPSHATSPQGRTKPRGKAGPLKGAVGAPSCSQTDAKHHPVEEKSVPTPSAAGLAWPRRWLVGGRHGPRSLHPPYGEGITQPLVSYITAACHLTVHLVAL